MTEKILITGGAGFVGSIVARRLVDDGYDVVLLDDMSFGHFDNVIAEGGLIAPLTIADIRDPDLVRHLSGVDAVLHFAGIAPLPVCQADPRRAYDVNTSGTANVLEAARRAGVRRVLFASTSAVYENSPPPHHPADPVAPDLVYASTKVASESICRGFAQNYDLDVIICRFFNVYGPHQDIQRTSPPFTSYVAKELVNGRRPVLYNNSDVRRDYVHASDMARLFVAMLRSEKAHRADVYNVASGSAHSVPELYHLFLEVSGLDIEAEYRDPTGFWDAYPELFDGRGLSRERVRREVFKDARADNTATCEAFDWTPEIDIRAGIESVYEYALAHAVGR